MNNKRHLTNQEKFWKGKFGEEYNRRNFAQSVEQADGQYVEKYGVSRSAMNEGFLAGLDVEHVLEVGCNIGVQLMVLQAAGRTDLYGIDIQRAVNKEARARLDFVQASARDIPFKDACFDLVFTSGLLIHILPDDLKKVMSEMVRVSKRYIWGFEYFSPALQEINYRGHSNALWKANFPQLFLDNFPGLKLLKEKKYNYLGEDNVDVMYLLEKESGVE